MKQIYKFGGFAAIILGIIANFALVVKVEPEISVSR